MTSTVSFASSYRQNADLADTWDAIVIGSGMGGLTAASLLARHGGKRVLLLERHYAVGGFTHVFRRPGFDWDVGLHYVGQMQPGSPARAILDHLTGGELQWEPMPEVYDRIFIGHRSYDFPAGRERFREAMRGYFPEESRAVDGYLDAVHKCARWSALYFAEKVIPPLLAAPFGRLMRWSFLRYARQTTAAVVARFTNNPELAGVLTAQWGDYGLPPGESSFGIHAIVAEHYLDGASYPRGGSARIAATMAPGILNAGGAIVTHADVAGILTDDGDRACGVRLADGREIHAKVVVSDIGAADTLGRLAPVSVARFHGIAALKAVPPSCAHICLYLGLDRPADELGFTGTNLWICPSADHDGNLRRSASDPGAPFPAVYISFPSAKDPAFEERHPGHSTIEALSLVPYAWFEAWDRSRWFKRGAEYEQFKWNLEERLLDKVYQYAPGARGHVIHAELSTPLSTRHFTNHARGEIYGLAHTPARFELRSIGPRTAIPNLFLTGQDVTTCGVMGAASSGILAASAILRRNLFPVLTRV